MDDKQYKMYINRMLSVIHGEKSLSKIYAVVHREFINTPVGETLHQEVISATEKGKKKCT